MPIHLDAVTNGKNDAELLTHILQVELNSSEEAFATEDKKFFHLTKRILDVKTNEQIGKFVFTLFNNEEQRGLEILDLDVTLLNPNVTTLYFIERLDGSSDSNEYYDVHVADGGVGQIETVNRHIIADDVLDTEQKVSISAFPYQLDVYENMEAFNLAMGFGKDGIDVGKTGIKATGLSPHFISPGSAVSLNADSDEKGSFLIGTVKDYKGVAVKWGERQFDFVIATLDTGFGVIPAALNREYFDLAKLKEGAVVQMLADIKADFAV